MDEIQKLKLRFPDGQDYEVNGYLKSLSMDGGRRETIDIGEAGTMFGMYDPGSLDLSFRLTGTPELVAKVPMSATEKQVIADYWHGKYPDRIHHWPAWACECGTRIVADGPLVAGFIVLVWLIFGR